MTHNRYTNNYHLRIFVIFAVIVLAGHGCAASSPPESTSFATRGDMFLRHGVDSFAAADYPLAEEMFDRSLAAYRRAGDSEGVFLSLFNLAQTHLQQRNYDQAARFLDQAGKTDGFSPMDRRILLLRSNIALLSGDTEQAAQTLAELLPAERNWDDTRPPPTMDHLTLAALANRTRLAFMQNTGNAKLWSERLQKGLQESGNPDPHIHGRSLRFQAELENRSGNHRDAEQLLTRAVDSYHRAGDRPAVAATLMELATTRLSRDEAPAARQALLDSAALYLEILDRHGASLALTQLRPLVATGLQAEIDRWLESLGSDGPVSWSGLRRFLDSI